MNHIVLAVAIVLIARHGSLPAAEPVRATFDAAERPKNWIVNFGHWEPQDGVLVCREQESDKHAAASRWQLPLIDAVIRCRLKFKGATAFHIGFDPASGQLSKQGHLYSLVVTPTGAALKKHRDKSVEASVDTDLAKAQWPATSDWLEIELRTIGDEVGVHITGPGIDQKLTASDTTFHVAKPTVVFRCVKGDAWLDDVSVTVTKPGLISAQPGKAK